MGTNPAVLASLFMGASSAASSYNSAQAARLQGDFASQQGEQNAKFAQMQAGDAIKQGASNAAQQEGKAKRLVGDQRVAEAANGNDVNSGSARDLQGDSTLMGKIDAATIQNNAYRQAWGYETQATQARLQGRLSQIAGNASATNSLIQGTLLTGAYGLQAYGGSLKSTGDVGVSSRAWNNEDNFSKLQMPSLSTGTSNAGWWR